MAIEELSRHRRYLMGEPIGPMEGYNWGTVRGLTPYMPDRDDSGGVGDENKRLRYPGSGPETFVRNGVEYTRGFGKFHPGNINEWLNQYLISDPEFGDALPTTMTKYLRSEDSLGDKLALSIGMGMMGLPLAAASAGMAGASAGGAMDMGIGLQEMAAMQGAGLGPGSVGGAMDMGIGLNEMMEVANNYLDPSNFTDRFMPNEMSITPVNDSPLLDRGMWDSWDSPLGTDPTNLPMDNGINPGSNEFSPGPMTDAADNLYNPGNPYNPSPNITSPTSGAQKLGLIDQLAQALGLPVDEVIKKVTTNPLLAGGIKLLEFLNSRNNAQNIADANRQAADRADPFFGQRQFYQDRLKSSYTDPNFFQNDPVFSGIRNIAINDVGREAAARGYNNSSNVLHSMGQRIGDEGMKYALGYQGQLGQLAGAGISPQEAGRLTAQGAQQTAQARNQQSGSLGDLISTIPSVINGIKTSLG